MAATYIGSRGIAHSFAVLRSQSGIQCLQNHTNTAAHVSYVGPIRAILSPKPAPQALNAFLCAAYQSSFVGAHQPGSFYRTAHSGANRPSTQSPIRAGASGSSASFQNAAEPDYLQLAKTLAKRVAVALAITATLASVAVFSLPWFLSTPTGLKTSTYIYNASIPGTVSVASADLGWKKPVRIDGVKVVDERGLEVLSFGSIESEATLWNLVTGRSGLGNTTVQGLRVDIGKEETGEEPRALAALKKPEKPSVFKRALLKATAGSPLPKVVDEVAVDVDINIDMPGGSLKFPHALFTVPWETAALTGDTVQVDVAAGGFAARRDSEAAALATRGGGWKVPIVAAARSEKFRGAAAGAVNVWRGELQLAQPLEANIEINPATGQMFLARLNPLLAGVVGTKESGQLVQVHATPKNMILPTEEYSFKVEPMTLVLGHSDLIGNALELVGQRGPGKTLTMRTSAIRATWNAAGRVEAARTDLQIGNKVHLITWGKMDGEQNSIDMVLAIPADTLKLAVRVPSVPSAYNLQFPLTGSVDRPTVDWKGAGKQLAKLVVRQRAPNGWAGLLLTDRNDHQVLPEALDPIPWERS